MLFGLFGKKEEPEEDFEIIRTAKINTEHGTLHVEFFEEDAPQTIENFCNLALKGFYRNMVFHKVIPDTLVQTGCPKGDGTGSTGYFIKCELFGKNQEHERGVLSMANSGRNTGSSQFFICLDRNNTEAFNGNNTCFGKVIEDDLEYLDKIEVGCKMHSIEIIVQRVLKDKGD